MKKYLVALMLSPALAFAQVRCIDTEQAVKQLTEKYKEHPTLIAKIDGQDDRFITVWKTPDGKQGSLTITSIKEGKTCLLESLEGVKIVGVSI